MEYQKARETVVKIFEGFNGIIDLVTAIKSSSRFIHSGNAEKDLGLAKFLYTEIVKKVKTKYKIKLSDLYKSDLYAMTLILHLFDTPLKLGQSYVFIDEGQDISVSEFKLIKNINNTASFNIFGDTLQNISIYRGIRDWKDCLEDAEYKILEQNYRNTNQIVSYVKEKLDINMQAIGFDGKEVEIITYNDVENIFAAKNGLKAIICQENYKKLYKKSDGKYNFVAASGKISKTKINIMTVAESKGLEFSIVAVFDKELNLNEKYIAYTRALKELYIIGE